MKTTIGMPKMKNFGILCCLFILPAVITAGSYKDNLKDYSCYHWYSWQLNKNDNYSSTFGAFTEIMSSEYISSSRRQLAEKVATRQLHDHGAPAAAVNTDEVALDATLLTTGWKVTFTGIPRYTRNVSSWDMSLLNGRPNYDTDFKSGPTVSVGDTVNFGDNIGYRSTSCTLGFWPPGPDCPDQLSGEYVWPIQPARESSSSGCYASTELGYFVNGVPIWNWADTTSYKSEDTWHNLAMKFEFYDVDMCFGHAASGEYHHHSYSPCLMDQLDDDGTDHSPIHGFAFDGYPIFGPYQAANTLAVSCWSARDYSSSETGCSGGQRTCTLYDPFDYTKGTNSTSYSGPLLNSTVDSQSGNTIYVTSGSYYEDFYYNSSCYAQGGQYLDSHNGHDHDGIGYHYHLTMDSDGVPTFPYSVGPKYYGCLPSSSQSCGSSYLYGSTIFGTSKWAKGTSTCDTSESISLSSMQCLGESFTLNNTYHPTMAPTYSQAPSQSPTKAPVGKPTVRPTASPTTRAPTTPTAPTVKPSRSPTTTASPTTTHEPSLSPTQGPPTVKPTVAPTSSHSPTKAPDGSGFSYNQDYACYHAYSWMENTDKSYSTNIGSFTDVISSSYTTSRRKLHTHASKSKNDKSVKAAALTTGWEVTFTGIPSYTRNVSAWDMSLLNSRPNKATDFKTGATTVSVGTTVNFGDNIGYKSQACTKGFWPPGPDCPEELSGDYIWPLEPAPENSTNGCYGSTELGYFVNGVPIWNWADTTSYESQGVWHNLAMKFEFYDVDMCFGHAAQGEYHHHSYSPCLMDQLEDDGSSHSPIHGFAYDGYPIFGPYQDEDTLAVSCWQARDYSSTSETGCSNGQRSCLLNDPFDYTEGTSTATYSGPLLNSTVDSQSGNTIYVTSGSYYEDFYYNSSCYAQGGQYLDSHNGHDHDGIGYHYHLTMDSDGVPTFPYSVGPKYYGCLQGGSQSCGTSYLYGSNIFGVDSYGKGTSSCGVSNATALTSSSCLGYSFVADTTSVAPTRAPTRSPTVKPTAAGPTAKPSAKPTTRAPTNTNAPTNTAAPTAPPTLAPTNQVSPILSFDATLSLTGLTTNTLDSTAEAAIISGAATAMDIDEDDISISEVTISSLRQRHLSEAAVKIDLSATYSASVTLTVVVNTVDFGTSNATAVYSALTSSLSTAQQSGNLTSYIQTAATSSGASSLTSVSVASLSVSAVAVANPPTYAPTVAPEESSGTSLGLIIGVAVGGFAFIVIVIVAAYYCCCKKSEAPGKSSPSAPSAPAAYGKVPNKDNAELELAVAVSEVKI